MSQNESGSRDSAPKDSRPADLVAGLQELAEIIKIAQENGYANPYGSLGALRFDKRISSNSNGASVYFELTVSSQISGYNSVNLLYVNKHELSGDTIKAGKFVSSKLNGFEEALKRCETELSKFTW